MVQPPRFGGFHPSKPPKHLHRTLYRATLGGAGGRAAQRMEPPHAKWPILGPKMVLGEHATRVREGMQLTLGASKSRRTIWLSSNVCHCLWAPTPTS